MCGMNPSKPPKSELDYQAEDDHRTLTRAEDIRADAARMKRVLTHHNKQTRSLKRIGKALAPRAARRSTRSARV